LAAAAGVGGCCVRLVLGRASVALNSTVEAQAVRPAVLGGLVVVGVVIATAVVAATVFVASSSVVAACLVPFFIRSEHGFSGCGLGFVGGQLCLKGPKFGVSALVSGS